MPAPPANQWGDPTPGASAWDQPGTTTAGHYAVTSAPPPLGPRPQSIKIATYLMIAGGILGLLQLVAAVAIVDLRALVEERLAAQPNAADLPPEAADAAYIIAIITASLQGVLGLALWLWMAWKNWQGRSWARVLATVLFGLGLLSFVIGMLQGGSATVIVVLNLLTIAVGGIAIFMIWRKESSEYYEAVREQRSPQYQPAGR